MVGWSCFSDSPHNHVVYNPVLNELLKNKQGMKLKGARGGGNPEVGAMHKENVHNCNRMLCSINGNGALASAVIVME